MVDGGETINLMPYFLLKKIGKYDTNMRPHNMVMSNYEGKTNKALGVIHVDTTMSIITRPTLFVVITTKKITIL